MQGHYPGNRSDRPCGAVWRRSRRVRPVADGDVRSARLFLCAECRAQAMICSCCDRGQVYCAGGCARQARQRGQRAAGQRFQTSRRGRHAHAMRARRYRARGKKVTHQGSPNPPADDPLALGSPKDASDAASPGNRPRPAGPHCHWCGRRCLEFVRQGFLRRRVGRHSRQSDRKGTRHGDVA